jgi:2-deoxy-D-gluconate 3-dehydrogenase
VHEAIEEQLPFDILVNNAGMNRPGPLESVSPEDYDAVMDVNVRSVFFTTKKVIHKMRVQGLGGSIINVSSQMGRVGGIDRTIYCASKHAIEGFTRALAIELGPVKIRVNTVCPTFIRTPLTESTFADAERLAWIESKIKLGRVGEIEDVMGAFVFLASDAAALITGSSLMIDGGWTAG